MTHAQSKRLLEMIPGIISWSILLFPLIFSFLIPEFVAIFYILFSLFWLLRALSYSAYLLWTHHIYSQQKKVPWTKFFQALEQKTPLPTNKHIPSHLRGLFSVYKHTHDDHLTIQDIRHILIVATYKEPYEVLEDTLESVSASHFALKNIILVLATEERDRENADAIFTKLHKKFGKKFGGFLRFEHPKDIPGEVPGKGGNITHACKETVQYLTNEGILTEKNRTNFVVTTLDADNKLDPEYFRILTVYYFLTPNRTMVSYQPLPFLYNNIWRVPIFNRIVAISSTFWHLIESGRKEKLRNFSSHAQPLAALMDMNFWSTGTIVEDGHQFWRSYIHFRGKYAVVPIFIPIYQDAVEERTYTTTLIAQYKQLRRWAYGAEDIAFMFQSFWKYRKELPIGKTILLILQLLEGHLMWATAPLILTISSYTPHFLNPHFTETTMYYNLSIVMGYLFSISILGILVSIWLSFVTLPPIPAHISPQKRFYLRTSLIFQWFLLPITTVLFAAIPALETQTRLLFGNKLGFNVTAKLRK